MIHFLPSNLHLRIFPELVSCIGIAVVLWKRTARYIEPDAVFFEEYIARDPQVNVEFINDVRRKEFWRF